MTFSARIDGTYSFAATTVELGQIRTSAGALKILSAAGGTTNGTYTALDGTTVLVSQAGRFGDMTWVRTAADQAAASAGSS